MPLTTRVSQRVVLVFLLVGGMFVAGCSAKVQRLGTSLKKGMTEAQVREILSGVGSPTNVVKFQMKGDTIQVLQYDGHPLASTVYDVEYVLVNNRYVAGGAYENTFDLEVVNNLKTYLASRNDRNIKKLEVGMSENEVQSTMGHVPRPDVPQPEEITAFNDLRGNIYKLYRYYTQRGEQPLTPVLFKNGTLIGVGREHPEYRKRQDWFRG